jgi:peptidoglycan/LPS O-acetylase OafA/YrhL
MILPIIRLPEFFIGVLLGLMFLRLPRLVENLSNLKATGLELGVVILVLSNLAIYPLLPDKTTVAVCLAPTLAILVAVFAYQQGQISKILSHKIFVYLGEISFSFYMIHMMVIGHLGAIGHPGLTALAFGLTLLLSVVVYRFIEEPARVRLKRRLDIVIRRRQSPSTAKPLEPSLEAA